MPLPRIAIGTMTIGRKLFLSFGAVMAITLLIALGALVNNAALSATVERVVYSTSVKQAIADEIDIKVTDLISIERGLYLHTLVKRPCLHRGLQPRLSRRSRQAHPALAEDSNPSSPPPKTTRPWPS